MTGAHQLSAQSLSLGYGGRTIVENLDVTVAPGAITSIVGGVVSGGGTFTVNATVAGAPTLSAESVARTRNV